jgi:hypothetical protein
VVFPARVFHVKSRVSCGLIPLLVVVYSPSFITHLIPPPRSPNPNLIPLSRHPLSPCSSASAPLSSPFLLSGLRRWRPLSLSSRKSTMSASSSALASAVALACVLAAPMLWSDARLRWCRCRRGRAAANPCPAAEAEARPAHLLGEQQPTGAPTPSSLSRVLGSMKDQFSSLLFLLQIRCGSAL